MNKKQPTPFLKPVHHEGRQLKEYLRANDITAADLARWMHKSPRAIQNYFATALFTNRIRSAIYSALDISDEQMLEAWKQPEHHQGERLRAYLKRKGINYAELAVRLGRTKSVITEYMRVQAFSTTVRRSILSALGVSYAELFGTSSVVAAAPKIVAEGSIDKSLVLIRRQLAEWQRLLLELQAAGVSTSQIEFCQYQIWHLELALSASNFSLTISLATSEETKEVQTDRLSSEDAADLLSPRIVKQ